MALFKIKKEFLIEHIFGNSPALKFEAGKTFYV
jgi:hypothetical protein